MIGAPARRPRSHLRPSRVVALAALAAFGALATSGCKKKKPPAPLVFDAAPPPERAEDKAAKETVRAILEAYPPLCEADRATRGWTACRDRTTGYAAIHACALRGQRDADAALTALRPSVVPYGECGEAVRTGAVQLVNATPRFFAALVRWLEAQSGPLAPALQSASLVDACREHAGLCATEPHVWDEAYRAMQVRTVEKLDCTARLFTCGRSETADCSLASVVPRLGVACMPDANRAGTSPDDLLYVRGTGLPLAR